MAVDERARHELHVKLEEVLGAKRAATLMAQLPPVGWAGVATKRDFVELEQRLSLRFEEVERRFEEVERRLEVRLDAAHHELVALFRGEFISAVTAQTRTMIFSLVGALAAVSGLALALARLG